MNFSPVIEIKNLSFFYGKGDLRREILKDISLTIQPEEVVVVTGPSGSGKTTLLSLMGCLRRAEKGSIKLFNHEIVGCDEVVLRKMRRNIGFIFQNYNLLPFLTALQNVCVSLNVDGSSSTPEKLSMASALLEELGLSDVKKHYPKELSGGQKQRVSIARALVGSPKVILADEPTASLDSKNGHECVRLLRDLSKKRGAAVLLVTHDYRILDMADRIINLEDGKIKVVQ